MLFCSALLLSSVITHTYCQENKTVHDTVVVNDQKKHDDHAHADNAHEGHDHSNHGHEDHDHADHSHADHDHVDREHADHSHKNHDHADNSHEGHDHADHSHVDHDHADHDHQPNHHNNAEEHQHHHEEENLGLRDGKIWAAAIGAIFAIGACGIFGVLVIPIMNRKIYQFAVQFLIALAVGTLTGDALLHLLPHAIMGALHTHGHGGQHHHQMQDGVEDVAEIMHRRSVWIGFVAAVAIIGFFLFEKIVNVLGEWKNSHTRTPEKKVRVVREGHVASDKAVGENVCKHKYSPYCVKDFAGQGENEVSHSMNGTPKKNNLDPGCEKALLPAVSDSVLNRNYSVGNHTQSQGYVKPEQDTVIISHHEVVHHGHSHAHSHIHSAPDSISSVAWMVIFGDGIHNLADGLAIGAAFADGLWSGVSTSIAVLCHELPHEIGDFAMLLKTGMSFKKAVFYNVVSSVLAFVGMLIGLVLGNVEHFSSWMFAATAGVFLYVALVDMMPELSSGHTHPLSEEHQTEGHIVSVILQLLGMGTGVGIMTIIALYEEDFKTMLVDY